MIITKKSLNIPLEIGTLKEKDFFLYNEELWMVTMTPTKTLDEIGYMWAVNFKHGEVDYFSEDVEVMPVENVEIIYEA